MHFTKMVSVSTLPIHRQNRSKCVKFKVLVFMVADKEFGIYFVVQHARRKKITEIKN